MSQNPPQVSVTPFQVTDYELPSLGSIVKTHYPHQEDSDPLNPTDSKRPKPRPGLVVGIDPTSNSVQVVYGTTQRTDEDQIYDTEFVIRTTDMDFEYTGLAHDTKFNFERIVQLPFNSEYFSKPNSTSRKTYHNPRMGVLPYSYHDKLRNAAENAKKLR